MNSHIRSFAFLLIFQALAACQQVQDNLRPLAASLEVPDGASFETKSKPQQPFATNLIFQFATDLVFQTVDGGQTWQDVSTGLAENYGIWSVFAADGKVFLGTENGLYHSTNPPAAQSWEKEIFLEKSITNIFSGPSGTYVCSYEHGIFKQLPGSDVWMPMGNTLKDKTVRTLLETPDRSIFVGTDNGIFKSTDSGETWKQVSTDSQVSGMVAANGVLIGCSASGLLRSTDAGEHWACVLSEDGQAEKIECIGDRFVAITHSGGSWQKAAKDPESMVDRLRYSDDGGKTWQRMDDQLISARLLNGMGEDLQQTWAVNDIKKAGEYLFCSLDSGIFRSSDGGGTWELVRPANGKKSLRLIVSGQTVYAVVVPNC